MALDPSTIDLLDTTSNGNHATIHNNTNGGLTTGEDENGKYLEFDGTTTNTDKTYIELNHTLLNSGAFTFDIVFKIADGYTLTATTDGDDNVYQGAGPAA